MLWCPLSPAPCPLCVGGSPQMDTKTSSLLHQPTDSSLCWIRLSDSSAQTRSHPGFWCFWSALVLFKRIQTGWKYWVDLSPYIGRMSWPNVKTLRWLLSIWPAKILRRTESPGWMTRQSKSSYKERSSRWWEYCRLSAFSIINFIPTKCPDFSVYGSIKPS